MLMQMTMPVNKDGNEQTSTTATRTGSRSVSDNKNTGTESENSTKSSPPSSKPPSESSQVLISRIRPRSIKCQHNRNQQGQNYYILGWTWLYSSSSSKDSELDKTSRKNRVTILAGVLDASPSSSSASTLDFYRSRIQQLKSKIEKLGGCMSLVSDLDIVARFVPTDAYSNDDDEDSNLPILDDSNGYICWKDKTRSSNDDAVSDNAFYQIMNFSLNRTSSYAHFKTRPTGDEDSEWSLILHRMNHCEEMISLVARPHNGDDGGLAPSILPPLTERVASQKQLVTESKIPSDDRYETKIFLPSIVRFPTLYLHVSSYRQRSLSPSSSSFSSILSIFPAYRTIRDLRQLSSKYPNDSSTNLCDCCPDSRYSIVPPRSKLVKQTTDRWNAFCSSFVDMIVGWFICAILVLLIRQHAISQQQDEDQPFSFLNKYLQIKQMTTITKLVEQISWLETFPTGFKLNIPLTQYLGVQIRQLLQYQERILLATTWDPTNFGTVVVPTLASLAAIGGSTMFWTALIDLWWFEMIHFIVLATIFRRLYQIELYLLSALFRLFRGKKYNPLRQRTDTNNYDAMQLMVGTIAFCVCIFLWTTLWYYHTFFCLWNMASHIPIATIWISYLLVRCIPFGSLIWWSTRPDWFPRDQFLKFATSSEPRLQICKLCSKALSPVQFIRPVISNVAPVMQWFLKSSFGALFPHLSDASSPCTLPLETYMETLQPLDLYTVATTSITIQNMDSTKGSTEMARKSKLRKGKPKSE